VSVNVCDRSAEAVADVDYRAVFDTEGGSSTTPIASPSPPLIRRQLPMANATVEVLIDDLDGTDGAQTVTLGWGGDWRELDLSKRNLASLCRAMDKVVILAGQPQARHHGNPRLGDTEPDRGTSSRPHPQRGRTTVQRGERPVAGIADLCLGENTGADVASTRSSR
jgi:hypothetical protein